MFAEIAVGEDIKRTIEDLLENLQWTQVTEIKYYTGSQLGDGFGSKPIAVEVRNGQKSLHFFLKCAIGRDGGREKQQEQSYANEIFFYDTIYPLYHKFLEDRGIKWVFDNAPKYYGSRREKSKDVIILDNLRAKGYTLFNRHKLMNDAHLGLIMKTFAKFHAISFALKDQKRRLHDELCEKCHDITPSMEEMGFYKVLKDMANDFLSKLDPEEDKDILEVFDHSVVERMADYVQNSQKYVDEYSVLTKGDCWSNNMMLSYKDTLEEDPIHIMLVDWQLVRRASPVHDLQNLFFSVVSEETLLNSDRYLRLYHRELSKRITELGSDPEVLYPYKVFREEWKQLGPFGYGVALILIKMMLSGADETPNFDGMKKGEEFESVEEFIPSIKKENEYMKRMKYITRYFIKNEML